MRRDRNLTQRREVRNSLELGDAAEEQDVGEHGLVRAGQGQRAPRVLRGRVLLPARANHLRVVAAQRRPLNEALDLRLGHAYEKRHSFLNFPYVCPEPVLVKRCILYINGAKSGVFRTAGCVEAAHCVL
jgi:hypothetical protein